MGSRWPSALSNQLKLSADSLSYGRRHAAQFTTLMKRVLILGCAGTGKSTLARQLGERLDIRVVHLDAMNWQPGWNPRTPVTFRALVTQAVSADAWITDGNYAVLTFDLRMPRADLVIWLERPMHECFWRVFKRACKSYFTTTEHLAHQCPERFDRRFLDRLKFIANFERINRPRIEALRVLHGPDVPVIVLRNDREISAFLAAAARQATSRG